MPSDVIVKIESVGSVAGASQRALGKALKIVAGEIEEYIKAKSSRPSPPRSKPGQYPRMETGEFVSGVRVTATEKYVTIRSEAVHGKFLEEGTISMDPRPWALRALYAKNWEKRIADLARRMTGGPARKGKK